MKKKILKIYLVSIALVFYSCDKNETKYLDNKLIEGKWYNILGKDSMVYTFKNNKAESEFYAHILGWDTLKFEGKKDLGNYLLTDSLIILPQQNKELGYRFCNNNKDSLYIKLYTTFWFGMKRLT